jgi:acetyl esterase/lipase
MSWRGLVPPRRPCWRNGSPNRLFVGGHSAGGQIAALMTLRKDWLAEGDYRWI